MGDERIVSAVVTGPVDVAIIGGGIVGLATALRLLEARPDLRLAILEREAELATHQSGHNSGVVHAGLYYAPGSLKARLCREGKAALEAFCDEHGIPVERCGKLVVALDETSSPRLEALHERASRQRRAGSARSSDRSGSTSWSRTQPGSARSGARPPASSTSAGSRAAYADEVRAARREHRDGARGPGIERRADGTSCCARRPGTLVARAVIACAGLGRTAWPR